MIPEESAAPEAKPQGESILADYIAEARSRYSDPSVGNIEIDDEPKVSIAEGGAWVAAWVWVGRSDSLDGN